jgi:hypothetical protein
MNFFPFSLYCTPSYATITNGGNANGGSAAVTHLRTATIFRLEHLGTPVLNPSTQFSLSVANGLRTRLFRIPASAPTSLPLRRQASFGFRASRKGAFYQQKCQANPRPQRPITTLYLSIHPNSLIRKAPYPREFAPKTNPHNAPKIPILLITPRSRPRNPHLSRKERRKKISILNFRRQKFNKGQRPKSYEKIPPLTRPRQERQPPAYPNNPPILPILPPAPAPLPLTTFLCKTNPILLDSERT